MDFNDYNATFTQSADFPSEARERVPSDLWSAFDGGNKAFFQPLATNQPRTYEMLTSHCGRISLLEAVSKGMGISNIGKRQVHYQWGIMCGQRFVVGHIPVATTMKGFAESKLVCLPEALHGYYRHTDGMTIPGPQGPGLVDYDLPSNIGGWRDLDYYRQKQNLPKKVLSKINRDFGEHDLRIFLYGSRGDLIMTDMLRKDRKLYHIKDNAFDDYALLENPTQKLDAYFANALLGFPELVDLRRG